MSDCKASIYEEFDEPCTIWKSKIVRANKPHKCCECERIIDPGEKYERLNILYDGDFCSHATCLVCMEIANAFCVNGRLIEHLWEGMNECDVWEHLTTACFDRLQTVEAKTELRRRWMQWKGLPQ